MLHQTAHNLNNQLMVVLGWGDLLAATMRDDDERRNALDAMLDAAHRAAALTRQLLDASRDEDPR